jgi:transposase-like protein
VVQNDGMARPSSLTPERTREVEARLAGGASIKSAAEAVGVNPRTLGRWLAEGRVQRRSLRLVGGQATDEPDVGGQEFEKALVTGILRAGREDWRALAWLLDYGERLRRGRP